MSNIENEITLKLSFEIKRLILTITTLVLVSVSFSQSKIKFTEPLSVENFNFYIDTVYVAQEEQKIVGYHWMPNSKETYKLKKGKNISLGLQKLFDESFPNDDGTKKPLIIRINKILYSASIVSSTSDLILHISFIRADEDSFYHQYTTYEAYYQQEIELGMTMFKVPEKKLRQALTSCFNKFVENYSEKNRELISREEILSSSLLYEKALVQLNSETNDTINGYKTFSDFIAGNNFNKESIEMSKFKFGKSNYYYKIKDTVKEDPHNYLIIYNGEKAIIREKSTFYLLDYSNEKRVTFLMPKDTQRSQAIPVVLGLGTAMGVGTLLNNNTELNILSSSVIVGVIAAGVYFTAAAVIKNLNKPMVYELDLLTGYTFRIK